MSIIPLIKLYQRITKSFEKSEIHMRTKNLNINPR